MKRYICADCRKVYTLRPVGYWPRHHLPTVTIADSLNYRVTKGTWDKSLKLTRQRQGHWLRALKKTS